MSWHRPPLRDWRPLLRKIQVPPLQMQFSIFGVQFQQRSCTGLGAKPIPKNEESFYSLWFQDGISWLNLLAELRDNLQAIVHAVLSQLVLNVSGANVMISLKNIAPPDIGSGQDLEIILRDQIRKL